MEAQLEQNEWQVLGHRVDHLETDPSSSSTGKVYSELHICKYNALQPTHSTYLVSNIHCPAGLMVGRYPQWYIGNVLSFVFGLGILGFGILALDVARVEGRCESAMSVLLSILATKFVVSEHVPRVHYLSLFDEVSSSSQRII
jgi:hypothetical protein